jgi:hypothetical protein
LKLVRVIAGVVGFLALYTAFFIYEDEQGRLQSRLEEMWVRIHSRAIMVGSSSSAAFGTVAKLLDEGFNRLFGNRLWSLQAMSASTAWSLTFVLGAAVPVSDDKPVPVFALYGFTTPARTLYSEIAAIFALSILMPLMSSSKVSKAIGLMPLTVVGFVLGAGLVKAFNNYSSRLALLFSLAVILSVVSDMMMIFANRSLIRYVGSYVSFKRILIVIVLQWALGFLLILLPIILWPISMTFFMLALLNIFSLVFSLLLSAAMVGVCIDRLLWPVIARLVYPLQKYEVVRNSKLLAAVGLPCILFAVHSSRVTVAAILQRIGQLVH